MALFRDKTVKRKVEIDMDLDALNAVIQQMTEANQKLDEATRKATAVLINLNRAIVRANESIRALEGQRRGSRT